MSSRTMRIALAATVNFVFLMLSPTTYADITFFADRADWESEANNRGFFLGEEDFDDAPDGRVVPMVKVGNVEVKFGVLGFNRIASEKVVPSWDGGAVTLGSLGGIFAGDDGSGVAGPVGGIGFDVDLNTASERFITVVAPPERPAEAEGLWIPDPNDFVSTSQQYAGDGFVGVLFDLPRDGRRFSFGGVNGTIEGVDNLVVAAAVVPEPSTFSLIIVAFLTLSLVRKRTSDSRSQQD